MLVLTRRDGESFFIGSVEIQVRILGIKGGQVRVGIDAPKSMPVFREEVKDQFVGQAYREPQQAVG